MSWFRNEMALAFKLGSSACLNRIATNKKIYRGFYTPWISLVYYKYIVVSVFTASFLSASKSARPIDLNMFIYSITLKKWVI